CYAIVRVTTRDGRSLEQRCDKPRGMWGLPLTRDERLAKFRDCCEGALGADLVDQVIERVEALDGAASVAPLMDIVCRAKPVFPE
ncbi:MAG: hypothetical protein ACREF6_07155, partial [Alphaproteobacteria bacterium]